MRRLHTTDNPITYRALRIFIARNDAKRWGPALDMLLANPTDSQLVVFEEWGADEDFIAALDILADLDVDNAPEMAQALARWQHQDDPQFAAPAAPAAPGAKCMCGWRGRVTNLVAHRLSPDPHAACPNCDSVTGVTVGVELLP